MARARSRPAPAPRAPARASAAPAHRPSAPPATQQRQTAPMQAPSSSGGGLLSGMVSTVAQGFAFGTGSAIAHRAVGAAANAMTGGSEEAPAHHAPAPGNYQQPAPMPMTGGATCNVDQQNFMACLNQSAGNVDACQFYFEALQQCQRNGYAGAQM